MYSAASLHLQRTKPAENVLVKMLQRLVRLTLRHSIAVKLHTSRCRGLFHVAHVLTKSIPCLGIRLSHKCSSICVLVYHIHVYRNSELSLVLCCIASTSRKLMKTKAAVVDAAALHVAVIDA